MFIKILILYLFSAVYIFPASKEEIRNEILNLLTQLPSTTTVGILILDPLTQDTIIALNHKNSMVPASNTKLFTTAAALSLLGGDFEVSTRLFTEDSYLQDGVIDGNLYLKGYGNSEFTSEDLDTMITELIEKGINRITGNVIGDDSYFDEIYTRDDWIRDEKANVKLPPISAVIIDRNRMITYGRRGRRYFRDINNPPLYAATLLRTKLISNGISVDKEAVKGVTPENINLILEDNILLRDLVALINKHSDNFMAECLFKMIGAEYSEEQGNSFYSTQAVLTFVEDNGIFYKGTSVVDGSGISRFNQITAGAIAGLLEKMYFDIVNFEDFYNSLSIAGIDGTLKNRLNRTYAENNFHGKTGSLNGVTSLSGYLTTRGNIDLIVSMIFEFKRGGWNYHKSIEDQIVEILTELN